MTELDPELKAFWERVNEATEQFPYYTLNDARQVVRCSMHDYVLGKMAQMNGGLDADPWRVAATGVGSLWVSTVFLGIDMNHRRVIDEGEPTQCFETMVFGHPNGSYVSDRYSTWAEAEAGHKAIVEELQR